MMHCLIQYFIIVANKIKAETTFMAQQALRFVLAHFLLIFPLLLAGCTVKLKPLCSKGEKLKPVCSKGEQLSTAADPDSNEAALLETAQSIEKSLTILAAAQEAKSPPVLSIAPLITPEGGMGGTADIDWVGPIGPLMSRLGEMSNYRVKFLGTPPAIPIVVSISARQTVLAEILQNASFQAGQRAKILVFPENRVIEVRYLNY
jgi:defect in organelle trafficking protein DotD